MRVGKFLILKNESMQILAAPVVFAAKRIFLLCANETRLALSGKKTTISNAIPLKQLKLVEKIRLSI
jgi:hypothetical protein